MNSSLGKLLLLLICLLVPLACVDHTLKQSKVGARAASGPAKRASSRPMGVGSKAAAGKAAPSASELEAMHGGQGASKILEAREGMPDWSEFSKVLARAVVGKSVDYSVIAKEKTVLDQVLAAVSKTDVGKLDKQAQLSFYINAYNAGTLRLVLDHVRGKGPGGKDLAGVLEVEKAGGIKFFDSKQILLGGTLLSLNEVEARGRALGDPRIHFAVNCASRSCPPLLNRAWLPATLEKDLDAVTKAYLASPEGLQLRAGRVFVSSIFQWYAKDFAGLEGVKNFLRLHAPDKAKALLAGELGYLDYDWKLNAK